MARAFPALQLQEYKEQVQYTTGKMKNTGNICCRLRPTYVALSRSGGGSSRVHISLENWNGELKQSNKIKSREEKVSICLKRIASPLLGQMYGNWSKSETGL